jgi:fatty acid desaturase
MAIAGAERSPSRHSRRLERRSRRRVARATTIWLASIAAWCLLFLALGWLVAAGFYGLLVNG